MKRFLIARIVACSIACFAGSWVGTQIFFGNRPFTSDQRAIGLYVAVVHNGLGAAVATSLTLAGLAALESRNLRLKGDRLVAQHYIQAQLKRLPVGDPRVDVYLQVSADLEDSNL